MNKKSVKLEIVVRQTIDLDEKDVSAKDDALQAAINDRIVEPRPFEGVGAMLGQGSTGSGPYRLSAKGSRPAATGRTFSRRRSGIRRTVRVDPGQASGDGRLKLPQLFPLPIAVWWASITPY